MRIITQKDIFKFTRDHASEIDAIVSKSYNDPYTQDVHYSELWVSILLGTDHQEQAVLKYLKALSAATANGIGV
mgnify:CR=1 FL=1